MTSLTTNTTPTGPPVAKATDRRALAQTLRLLVLTAWLATAVPLVGVLEVAWVRSHNPDLHPADPAVGSAFIGGAAIGLAIWTLTMLITLRRNRATLRFDRSTIWWLLAPWGPALLTWSTLREPLSAGVAAGCAIILLLAGWFMVWRSASVALR